MSKVGVSIVAALVGLAVGVFAGYLLFSRSTPEPSAAAARPFYYRLNDSMIVRHTISVSENKLGHRVDTVAIESR